MKLGAKFSLFSSLLVIGVILVVSVFLIIAEGKMLRSEMEGKEKSIVEGLAKVCEEAQITQDDLLVLNYIEKIKENESVSYAMYLDKDGRITAHSDSALIGTHFREESVSKEKIIDRNLPVKSGRGMEGSAHIGFIREVIENDIRENISKTRKRVSGIAAVALILGIFASLIMALTMTKPIKKLAAGSIAIGEGKLDTVIDVKSNDEIGGLAKQFNVMAVKLKELDQMKDDFVSSVTHELRSPLTAIKGYINFILDGKSGAITDKQREFLTIVANNTARLGRFINNVLDMAKIEAGMMEMKKEPMSIKDISAEMVTLLQPLADEKKLTLKIDVEEDIPEIVADPDKMRQVITNLVNNALKFTPEGGSITVEAKNFDPDNLSDQARRIFELKPSMFKKNEMVQITVKDTGIGIPEESIKSVFSKFQQVEGVRDKIKGPKGTGLGLSIVKGIIAAHKGRIWVESVVDKGTSFICVLPKKAEGPDEGEMKIFDKEN
ncbi:MAG: ATP-binding protein [bacterium]